MMSLTWAARTWCRLLVVLAVVGGVRASPSSLSAWGVLGEWSGDLD